MQKTNGVWRRRGWGRGVWRGGMNISEGTWEKSETEYLPLMNLATGGLNEINPRSMESPRVNSPTQEQMGPCGPWGQLLCPPKARVQSRARLKFISSLVPQGRKPCSCHACVSSDFSQRAPINSAARMILPAARLTREAAAVGDSPGVSLQTGLLRKGLLSWI